MDTALKMIEALLRAENYRKSLPRTPHEEVRVLDAALQRLAFGLHNATSPYHYQGR